MLLKTIIISKIPIEITESIRELQRVIYLSLTKGWSKQRWFSGRILACHAGGPGSIPGRCKAFGILLISLPVMLAMHDNFFRHI